MVTTLWLRQPTPHYAVHAGKGHLLSERFNVFCIGLESDPRNINSGQAIQTNMFKDYQRPISQFLVVKKERVTASEPDRNFMNCCVL